MDVDPKMAEVAAKIKDSPELMSKLKAATDQDSFVAAAKSAAEEVGFTVTSEEIKTYLAKLSPENDPDRILTDDELKSIAGGLPVGDYNWNP